MTRSQDIRARNSARNRLNSTKWTDATMAVILTSVKTSYARNDKQHIHPTGFSFTFLVERIRAGSRRFCNLSMKGVYIWRVCDRKGNFSMLGLPSTTSRSYRRGEEYVLVVGCCSQERA